MSKPDELPEGASAMVTAEEFDIALPFWYEDQQMTLLGRALLHSAQHGFSQQGPILPGPKQPRIPQEVKLPLCGQLGKRDATSKWHLIHSIWFPDGQQWDCVNGLRP